MEILNLQSSLQSEIHAKESIREELTQIRADFIAMQKWVLSCFSFAFSGCYLKCGVVAGSCGR